MAETSKSTDVANAADLDTSGAADIPAATTFSTSGAPVQIVPDVDPDHPAVDNNPRANTTADMNKIDFNDPRPTQVVQAEEEAAKASKSKS